LLGDWIHKFDVLHEMWNKLNKILGETNVLFLK